jgi:hypothetical protein
VAHLPELQELLVKKEQEILQSYKAESIQKLKAYPFYLTSFDLDTFQYI